MNSMEPTDLIVMNALTAEAVFSPGGVDAIIEKIVAAAHAIPSDISTASGRAAIKSIAYKVARSRTALDEMGKNLAAEWKKKAGAIDAERRTIRDRLEDLQEEVRKPLTDWEDLEKSRVAEHESQIIAIEQLAVLTEQETPVSELDRRIALLNEMPERDWQEFSQRASVAIAGTTASLSNSRALALKRDSDRAELERLRKEQIERERREREEKIAAEAAERARKAAEEKAKAEAEAAARLARETQEKADRARADAEARAQKAEADQLAAEAKANADAERAAHQAAKKQEEAVAAERKRVADAAKAEQAEAARREADKKHRAAINRAAVEAFVSGGMSEEAARAAVTLIAQKAIPNVANPILKAFKVRPSGTRSAAAKSQLRASRT